MESVAQISELPQKGKPFFEVDALKFIISMVYGEFCEVFFSS